MPAIPLRALEEDLARLAGLLARGQREDLPPARGIVSALRRALRARPQPRLPARARVPRSVIERDVARAAALLGVGPGPVIRPKLRRKAALEAVRALQAALGTKPAPIEPVDTGRGQERLELPMASAALVLDCPLGCPVSALVCVARQIQSEQELTPGTAASAKADKRERRAEAGRTIEALARHIGKRGKTPTRPACVTERCSVGASVRDRHGDTEAARAMARRAPRAADTSET